MVAAHAPTKQYVFNFRPKLTILQRLQPLNSRQFQPFSKSCHFSNISYFLEPSFAQNNSSVLLESFFACFVYFNLRPKPTIFQRLQPLHSGQFQPFSKSCHFSNISQKWKKNWLLSKGYRLYKMVSLGKKLNFTKTCEKLLYNHIRVVVCKKRLQKIPHIRKITAL